MGGGGGGGKKNNSSENNQLTGHFQIKNSKTSKVNKQSVLNL